MCAMPTKSETQAAPARRERFREYMRNLNPTAPARSAIDLGLTVRDLHGSIYQAMAARADLDPGSQQILVGGIGSGKTTELLLAEQWLKEHGQTFILYIDITAETDLSGLNSGALLAGLGLHLSRAFEEHGSANGFSSQERKTMDLASERIRDFAYGQHQTPGKLKPPFPPMRRDIDGMHQHLEVLLKAVRGQSLDTVVIFDGLDRLITPEKFWAVVDQDFQVLRRLQVAVIAAAPLSILYGSGRPISEYFDRVHHIPTLQGKAGSASTMRSVLAQRGAPDLLSELEIEKICEASGGVLRDLIALARDAGEAAYMDESDSIKSVHIKTVIKQLGESYLRGLNTDQLKALRALIETGTFDVSSRIGIELLVTRRVLEYSATDFRVHPALAPLIAQN